METADFFRARIDGMINLRDPLAVLATRLPWDLIQAALADKFAHADRPGNALFGADLLGPNLIVSGAGVSPAGRPKLPIRLMVSLLYLKHNFNLSDEELCERWSENVLWQFFSGMTYYEHRQPCDATQIGRFRTDLGPEGLELLLKTTIDTALAIKAIKPQEFERVIIDSTVQEKAIAYPVDSRLLEIARHKVVSATKRVGITLKQTFAKEGRSLRRRAGGYAHAKQFRRLQTAIKRQRTILGVVMREVERKCVALNVATDLSEVVAKGLSELRLWLDRAERIRVQQRKDKNKLYALHAPEVECIGKGKARKRFEFGVKSSLIITHKQGLLLGARTFTGNPYDAHTMKAALTQVAALICDIPATIKTVVADLGYRGVDKDNPEVEILHRGKIKSMNREQRRWLKRRQAVEPAIGHLKSDHRMDRCWLKGAAGDALHTLGCAAGYNLRWLLRAIARMGLRPIFLLQIMRKLVNVKRFVIDQMTLSSVVLIITMKTLAESTFSVPDLQSIKS